MRRNILPQAVIDLRLEKAWTQDHLARAAGVATRTVQRAERWGRCSAETVLALAAALDVDVTQLLVPAAARHGTGQAAGSAPSRIQRLIAFVLLRQLSPRQRAGWSLAALLPGAYFATANILYYRFGIPALYLPMQSLLDVDMIGTLFNLFSPVLFMGGLGWAILVNLDALISLRLVASDKPISGTFYFRPRLANGVVLGIAGIFLGILLLYLVVENAGHL